MSKKTLSAQDEARDCIVSTLEEYAKDCQIAYTRTFGFSGWFKAFIKSKDFAELSDENKGEAFKCYTDMLYLVEELSEQVKIMTS